MSDDTDLTPAQKLADAVRRKAEGDKTKGGGAPGRDAAARGASPGGKQGLKPSVSKRAGSFKGR